MKKTKEGNLKASISLGQLHQDKPSPRWYKKDSVQKIPLKPGMIKLEPSFLMLNKSIPNIEKTYDVDRLLIQPKHKEQRHKFDKSLLECLQEKENDPLT